MNAIINAKIVLENAVIDNGVILYENGKIVDFNSADKITVPSCAVIFDAKNNFVGPGFVDIHCHGGGIASFPANPAGAAEFHLKNGTTTILGALYPTLSPDQHVESLERIFEAQKNGAKSLAGVYMEGPYLNEEYGSNMHKNQWRGTAHPDDYKKVVDKAGKAVKVWAFAPERPGVEEFMKYAKQVNPDVVFSVAHSNATPAQTEPLKKYGVLNLTHCCDATHRQPCEGGTRNCGPDETCYLDDNMYAEMICDSEGIHVNPYMMKLIMKIKSKDKVILISDSTISDPSMPMGRETEDLNFDENDGLAGSKLTLRLAVRNLIKHTGVSISDAFKMASRNPARLIGMANEIGTIAVGKKANFVILKDNFEIENVILEGELVC